MEINVKASGSSVVRVQGRFDANECDSFNSRIDQLREAGATDLAIDLSEVDFIDSSALAVLVALSRWAEANQCHFELQNPSDTVTVILEMTGLDQAFSIRSTSSAADS